MIGNHGIDAGAFHQGLKVAVVEIGRTQQHAPRNPIEFRHHNPGYQLIRHGEQHRPSGEFAEPVCQAGLAQNIRQRHHLPRIRNRAAF
jgi:hypothetical protein